MKNKSPFILSIAFSLICACFESCNNADKEKQIASLEAQLSAYKDSLKSSQRAVESISNTMYQLSIDRAEILNRYCERLEQFDAAFFRIGSVYNTSDAYDFAKLCRKEREEYRECQNSWNGLASIAKSKLEK